MTADAEFTTVSKQKDNKKQRNKKKSNNKPPSFGSSWSGPSSPPPQPEEEVTTKATEEDVVENNESDSGSHNSNGITLDDFISRRDKSLSELMGELGERDPDFQNFKVSIPEEEDTTIRTKKEGVCRLGKHGKAPIHIEFQSFGYVHGAPSSKGWSHAQPLPPLDCREIIRPVVEPYLLKQDGKSSAVKKALNKNNNSVDVCVTKLTPQVEDALLEALKDGHGHAMPLRMTIFVGSELGRHRSLVVCEDSAKKLRTFLRTNLDNKIDQDVSIGTRHPDLGRKRTTSKETSNKKNRYKIDDDEW